LAWTLVIADIHGNIDALNAVLKAARSFDNVIILGDLVDYGPAPGEVIDTVKSLGGIVVRGNHDHAVAYGVDCGCGRALHELSVWFRENITMQLLSKTDREYLARLPLKASITVDDGINAVVVHGSPLNPLYGYLYHWLPEEKVEVMVEANARLTPRPRRTRKISQGQNGKHVKYVVHGHTHYQGLRIVKGIFLVNPGSVGQPRDSDPRAAYALVDFEHSIIMFGRVKYDVEKTLKRLNEFKIPEPYLTTLKTILTTGRLP
jgi:protein phosphatase